MEKREGKLQEASGPQVGEEQQSQPSLPAGRGWQDPEELRSDSQMLKVTLGQMDRLSVLSSREGWVPFPRVCSLVTG